MRWDDKRTKGIQRSNVHGFYVLSNWLSVKCKMWFSHTIKRQNIKTRANKACKDKRATHNIHIHKQLKEMNMTSFNFYLACCLQHDNKICIGIFVKLTLVTTTGPSTPHQGKVFYFVVSLHKFNEFWYASSSGYFVSDRHSSHLLLDMPSIHSIFHVIKCELILWGMIDSDLTPFNSSTPQCNFTTL